MDVKGLFEKFNSANFFSRVDKDHVLELYIGLDDKHRKAIELRACFSPKKVTGTAAIEVNQYRKEKYNTIRFSLCDEEVSGLFYMFCDDLIEQTRDLRNTMDGYTAIVNRFYLWKKMFVSSKANLLSEPEIMGLIGEILYLRSTLADNIGLYAALCSWSGQELTHKDFSYDSSWSEVKAISSGKQTVHISSLEQLDSELDGELAVYLLEKMSTAYKGITLNRLVIETRNMFSSNDDRNLFMTKAALQGYEYNDFYDGFVYEIAGFIRYRVSAGFPRLTLGDVGSAIVKASYDIDLSEIAAFEIC